MKKLCLAALVAISTAFGFSARGGDYEASDIFAFSKGTSVGEVLALYIPNRLLDALDMFTVNLGAGPVIEARLMGTRLVDVGAGIGLSAKAFKSHNRQYGFGIEEISYWSLIFIGEEDYRLSTGTSLVDKYIELRDDLPEFTRNYDFFSGPRDYFAIGGSLGCLIDGDLYIHPLEWVDFALGFFFIDIKQDDLTFSRFQ